MNDLNDFLDDLEPHQKDAVKKLSKLKVGALYMEQGTGKTRTAMQLAIDRYKAKKIDLIIWLCPCNVKGEIYQEWLKHYGSVPRFLVICGIETLSSSVKWNSLLLDLVLSHNTYLIIDESLLIKNGRAKRTKNITRLADHCQYKLLLNGTPISRNEADLFAQWYALDWRVLGYTSFYGFARNHVVWDETRHGVIRGIKNVDYLTKRIAPYSYQITKDEAYDIPRKTYYSVFCSMSDKQFEHYEDISYFLMEKSLLYMQDDYHIYQFFNALCAITSGRFVNFKEDGTSFTKPMFEDVKDNPRIQALDLAIRKYVSDQAIIFCKYQHEIDSVIEYLGATNCVEFTGRISTKNRQKALRTFRNGKAKYLVGNKSCAAFGLNLQFCNTVIFYDNDWTYSTRQQAEDRVHRRGQKRAVTIVDIIVDDSIDKTIYNCLMRKEDVLRYLKSKINSDQKEALFYGKEIQ